MEVYSKFGYNKRGFTTVDSVHLSIITFMLVIYLILIYKNTIDEEDIDLHNNNNNNVSTYDVIISVWGFILGLFVSSFVTRFLFREYGSNIAVISITFLVSMILLILYYIVSNYKTKQINISFLKYNEIIFPLLGGLFLIAEDSINHFFNYFGDAPERYSGGFNLDKFAGSLNEIRNALAKNNILSDTSTDYIGSSSNIFTTDSL